MASQVAVVLNVGNTIQNFIMIYVHSAKRNYQTIILSSLGAYSTKVLTIDRRHGERKRKRLKKKNLIWNDSHSTTYVKHPTAFYHKSENKVHWSTYKRQSDKEFFSIYKRLIEFCVQTTNAHTKINKFCTWFFYWKKKQQHTHDSFLYESYMSIINGWNVGTRYIDVKHAQL